MSWLFDPFTRPSTRKQRREEASGDRGRPSTLTPHQTRDLFGDIDMDRSLYPCPSAVGSSKSPAAPRSAHRSREKHSKLPNRSASREVIHLPSRPRNIWQRLWGFVAPKAEPRRDLVANKTSENVRQEQLLRRDMDDYEDSMAFFENKYMETSGFPDVPPFLYADRHGYRDIARSGSHGLAVVVQRPVNSSHGLPRPPQAKLNIKDFLSEDSMKRENPYPGPRSTEKIISGNEFDIFSWSSVSPSSAKDFQRCTDRDREFISDPFFSQESFIPSHNEWDELLFAAFYEEGMRDRDYGWY